jgi:hypothetical protein
VSSRHRVRIERDDNDGAQFILVNMLAMLTKPRLVACA